MENSVYYERDIINKINQYRLQRNDNITRPEYMLSLLTELNDYRKYSNLKAVTLPEENTIKITIKSNVKNVFNPLSSYENNIIKAINFYRKYRGKDRIDNTYEFTLIQELNDYRQSFNLKEIIIPEDKDFRRHRREILNRNPGYLD